MEKDVTVKYKGKSLADIQINPAIEYAEEDDRGNSRLILIILHA